MDGERISLRLGSEELELIDRFIGEHPEFSSRSQLARIAVRSFIESKSEPEPPGTRSNRVVVEIPKLALEVIEGMMRAGIYSSVGGAIEDCVRKEFVSKEYLEEVKRKIFEVGRETLEVVPDSD